MPARLAPPHPGLEPFRQPSVWRYPETNGVSVQSEVCDRPGVSRSGTWSGRALSHSQPPTRSNAAPSTTELTSIEQPPPPPATVTRSSGTQSPTYGTWVSPMMLKQETREREFTMANSSAPTTPDSEAMVGSIWRHPRLRIQNIWSCLVLLPRFASALRHRSVRHSRVLP